MARDEVTKTHLENLAVLPNTSHGDASADVAIAVYAPDANPNAPGTPTFKVANDGKVTATGFYIGDAQIVEAELEMLDGITAGTVAGSKAVVVSADKDAGDFRNLDATNLDAGASGTAGSVDVFPATASKGKITISAADSAGNTTTTITNASQAGARTYTIPDAGGNSRFMMATNTLQSVTVTDYDAQAATATIAALLGGVVTQNSKTGASTITTPTGTEISAGIPGVATGDCFRTVYYNRGNQTSTVTAGASGVTVYGTAGIATLKTAVLFFVCTGANTWGCYVVAGA